MWFDTLRDLRVKNNLTQSDIAKMLNISQVSYGRYEIGASQPKFETLLFLADQYKVTTDYIFGRTKYSIKANKELKQLLSKIQTDLEDIKKML
ncbi:MAG: hypothetical protein CVV56_08840 [Tenericutes bacterium HGW-Tenericutes-1]|jgi:transcriptional regulator with XRE-family HTH domain|nr:MAG: hypothetical protein CVV56_08840 [Tenericutes bacterium HGW-Tenericutes-1]